MLFLKGNTHTCINLYIDKLTQTGPPTHAFSKKKKKRDLVIRYSLPYVWAKPTFHFKYVNVHLLANSRASQKSTAPEAQSPSAAWELTQRPSRTVPDTHRPAPPRPPKSWSQQLFIGQWPPRERAGLGVLEGDKGASSLQPRGAPDTGYVGSALPSQLCLQTLGPSPPRPGLVSGKVPTEWTCNAGCIAKAHRTKIKTTLIEVDYSDVAHLCPVTPLLGAILAITFLTSQGHLPKRSSQKVCAAHSSSSSPLPPSPQIFPEFLLKTEYKRSVCWRGTFSLVIYLWWTLQVLQMEE